MSKLNNLPNDVISNDIFSYLIGHKLSQFLFDQVIRRELRTLLTHFTSNTFVNEQFESNWYVLRSSMSTIGLFRRDANTGKFKYRQLNQQSVEFMNHTVPHIEQYRTRLNLMLVCKGWRKLLHNSVKTIAFSTASEAPDSLIRSIFRSLSAVETVQIETSEAEHVTFSRIVPSNVLEHVHLLPNLTSLDLSFTDDVVDGVDLGKVFRKLATTPRIKHLTVPLRWGNIPIIEAMPALSHLETLHFQYVWIGKENFVQMASAYAKSLTSLGLVCHREVWKCLTEYSDVLQNLSAIYIYKDLNSNYSDVPVEIASPVDLLNSYPKLTTLSMSYYSVTFTPIPQQLRVKPQLTVLHLRYYLVPDKELNYLLSECNQLKELKIEDNHAVQCIDLHKLTQLTHLEIGNGSRLKSLHLTAPLKCIKHLTLHNLPQFDGLCIPALTVNAEHITIYACHSITSLNVVSDALVYIYLMKLESLRQLKLKSKNLGFLSITICPHITSDDRISILANCPLISQLIKDTGAIHPLFHKSLPADGVNIASINAEQADVLSIEGVVHGHLIPSQRPFMIQNPYVQELDLLMSMAKSVPTYLFSECKLLRKLTMHTLNCTDDQFQLLVESLPQSLEELSILSFRNVKAFSTKAPFTNLRKLCIMHCHHLTTLSIPNIANIRSIDVRGCMKLKTVRLNPSSEHLHTVLPYVNKYERCVQAQTGALTSPNIVTFINNKFK